MNPLVRAIGGSLIREIAAKRKSSSIDLGLGEPSLPPTMKYLNGALQRTPREGLRYTVNAGDLELRCLIAEHYAYPKYTHASNVCIMTGSQEAVYVAIKTLLDPAKDQMLLVEPAFPAYAKMARLEGVDLRTVSMEEKEDFAFDAQRILEALTDRTRLIVICSPSNPTGRVIRKSDVEELTSALLRRPGEPIYVLHDEIYREQTYIDDPGHFAAIYPYTIVTNSLSKSNALTGLRLGWTMTPHPIADAIVKAHAWVTSAASTLAQRVAFEIFRTPGALHEHAAWYREQCSAATGVLDASGLRYITPEGSFYACIQLPEGFSSLATAHDLADRFDVIAVPGVAFGECFEGWLRLSWVAPIDQLREGLTRIAEFCASQVERAPEVQRR
ncbi:MAG: pyridoxal phosphate-dependent aminotransferase [Candidatus Eremiobacteraeota bacterium]|nr:pyridoxal phosphate-dependent aminotransferase [Candidatus Eremiobacteraeota bacterium]